MKYTIAAVTLTAAMTTGASAQERDAAFKAAAAHIVTAHECAKITGDIEREVRATEIQKVRLVASGYTSESAEAAIAEINSYLKDDETKLTADMCTALLSMMEQ